jgi:hypothetical protein
LQPVKRKGRRRAVPKGRIVFWADGSPGGDDEERELWFSDPEEVLRRIAARNNATYVEDSLAFSPGGRHAEARFNTVEPEPDTPASRLHQLGIEIDALQVELLVGTDRWRYFKG